MQCGEIALKEGFRRQFPMEGDPHMQTCSSVGACDCPLGKALPHYCRPASFYLVKFVITVPSPFGAILSLVRAIQDY